jgi:phosphate-selective porin OprO/OprP
MTVEWKDGIRLGTADGATKLKIGGRIMHDWTFQSGEDAVLAEVGDLQDGSEFRRLRFEVSGTVHHVMIFKTQYDFAGGKVAIQDAFVGVEGIPFIGTITVGNQYEPIGLEETTSSKYITFLERNLATAFTPARNPGILATNHNAQVTWAAGIFREDDATAASKGDGEYNATGRIALRPINMDGGRRVVHLGVAGRYGNPPAGKAGFSSRPEVNLAPNYVSTGDVTGIDDLTMFGVEAAVVAGPFSVQAEYVQANLSTEANTDPSFSGYYGYVTYFLTGENRTYKEEAATFDRVKPKSVFDGKGGIGAWELAARFSEIELNDAEAAVSGGELRDITVGLNWYPNPNFRWMANYVRATLDGFGTSDALAMRFAADF